MIWGIHFRNRIQPAARSAQAFHPVVLAVIHEAGWGFRKDAKSDIAGGDT
jgi:hypothetical protein